MFRPIACLLLVTATAAVAEEKYKSEDLVGKWTQIIRPKQAESSVIITINKDGTIVADLLEGNAKIKSKGKWKLEGETLSITFTEDDTPRVATIVKLTADTLVIKHEDVEVTHKKVKEEKK